MEDVHGTIIATRGEHGIALVEIDLTQRQLMVTKRLVGLGAKIKIEPGKASIKASHDNIVTLGVYGHGGDPLHAREQFLHEGLALQIVHAYVVFGLHRREKKKTAESVTHQFPCRTYNKRRSGCHDLLQ